MPKRKPKRKIEGTLELAEGLLLVANMVDAPGAREDAFSAMGDDGSLPANPTQRRLLGKYQGRVVLASLAAELALKYAWEREPKNEGKPAPKIGSGHQLKEMFGELCSDRKEATEEEYSRGRTIKQTKSETAEEAFGQYKKPFEEFRYMGEYPLSSEEAMRATDLIQATKSLIAVARANDAQTVNAEL